MKTATVHRSCLFLLQIIRCRHRAAAEEEPGGKLCSLPFTRHAYDIKPPRDMCPGSLLMFFWFRSTLSDDLIAPAWIHSAVATPYRSLQAPATITHHESRRNSHPSKCMAVEYCNQWSRLLQVCIFSLLLSISICLLIIFYSTPREPRRRHTNP
jgi:hypothetical protein